MPHLRLALLPRREPQTQTIEHLQNRIYELEELLDARTEFPPMLELTLSEEALLGALFKREIVTQTTAFAILYGSKADGETPSDPKNVVSVLIMRLRKKIFPHGIDIKTRTGVGYYMTTDAKNRLRRITEKASQEQGPPLNCAEPEGERAVF
jgi:DNA-binding response OmpR family regulator